jgi:hypothetical protein
MEGVDWVDVPLVCDRLMPAEGDVDRRQGRP